MGDRGHQPTDTVALGEVLVNNHLIDQADAGAELHHALLGRAAAGTVGDHVLADGAGPRRGAAYQDARAVAVAQRLQERRAAQQRTDLHLVAAGEEHGGGRIDDCHRTHVLCLFTAVHPQYRHPPCAEVGEKFLVLLPHHFHEP